MLCRIANPPKNKKLWRNLKTVCIYALRSLRIKFKAATSYSMENGMMFVSYEEARLWEEVMLAYCKAPPRKRSVRLGTTNNPLRITDNGSRYEPETTKHNLKSYAVKIEQSRSFVRRDGIQGEWRYSPTRILNLGNTWRWSASHPGRFIPRGQWIIRGLESFKASFEFCKQKISCPCRNSNPGLSSP